MRRWKEYETVDQVAQTPDMQVISSRWVITEKDDGRYKARLVVRGFEDTSTHSPTHPKQAENLSKRFWLLLQMKVSRYKIWTLRAHSCREHPWKETFY